MADDGSGSDITIPAFLLFAQDADPIRTALQAHPQVRVQLSFSSAHERVTYDLWTTPTDFMSRNFLHSFQKAAIALGQDAIFTPHMYIYDGRRAGCQDSLGENQCIHVCTNNGLYCAADPDMYRGVSGANVVTESLRRMCVWSLYGSDGVGVPWWNYVRAFSNHCHGNMFTNETCIAQAMKQASVDPCRVNQCMTDSGEGNHTNALLEASLARQRASRVVSVPTLLVNEYPVAGNLSFSTAFSAVCTGFAPGSEPSVCKACASCQHTQRCVARGGPCSD
jgi:hypothetical protein